MSIVASCENTTQAFDERMECASRPLNLRKDRMKKRAPSAGNRSRVSRGHIKRPAESGTTFSCPPASAMMSYCRDVPFGDAIRDRWCRRRGPVVGFVHSCLSLRAIGRCNFPAGKCLTGDAHPFSAKRQPQWCLRPSDSVLD